MKSWIRNHIEEIFLVCCLVLTISMLVFRYGTFASNIDWLNQHSVFPDYFRKLFYKTGKIFPSFAANIGGGQNIYNFSYYGMLSPLILPSYLLPFVKMDTYIMLISALAILASVILLYRWLLSKGFMGKVSCSMAVIYLFSAPILFQSYTQWMFVNYMPFLVMAFIGVDRYMEKKKPVLLVLSVFLMIMTSYYFSIGGLFALGIYQISCNLRLTEKFKLKDFILKEIQFGLHCLLGVGMSAIFLIPTAFTLMGRSSNTKIKISLIQLFLPRINWEDISYSSYGIGLTTILITALISTVFMKKAWERMLGISLFVILVIPVFEYLLNGGLYLRGKVFIPFLPVLIYWIAHFIMKIRNREIAAKKVTICFLITILLAIFSYGYKIPELKYFIIADAVIMFLCQLGYQKTRKLAFLVIPIFSLLGISSLKIHMTQKNMLTKQQMLKVEDEKISEIITDLKKQDHAGYRIELRGDNIENGANINRIYDIKQYISSLYSSAYESDYDTFRKRIFEVSEPHRNILMQGITCNPAFMKLMGVKYLISNYELPLKKVDSYGKYQIYQNDNVAPLAFSTNTMLSKDTYEKLEFPYNQLAFSKAVVAPENVKVNSNKENEIIKKMQQNVREISLDLKEIDTPDTKIKKQENGYYIKTKNDYELNVSIPEINEINKKLLFVCFDVKNHHKNSDMLIRIGCENNKLTARKHIYYNENTSFHYGLEWNKENLPINLGEGEYEITNVKCYIADVNLVDANIYEDAMKITDEWSNGDTLQGEIIAKQDGYFVSNIPFGDGFQISVDGKTEKIQMINEAFVGCKIKKGKHKITIEYNSPGLKAGMMISLFSMLGFVVIAVCTRQKK